MKIETGQTPEEGGWPERNCFCAVKRPADAKTQKEGTKKTHQQRRGESEPGTGPPPQSTGTSAALTRRIASNFFKEGTDLVEQIDQRKNGGLHVAKAKSSVRP